MKQFFTGLAFCLATIAGFAQCQADYTVEASSFVYAPMTLTIEQGESVAFLNIQGFHNVNGVTNTLTGESFNNPFDFYLSANSGNEDGACMGTVTFDVPGTYNYDCSLGNHAEQGMVGSITVNALPTNTVFDVIAGSQDHNLLEAAVLAADLAGTLSAEGPFTVFAPTDDAIDAFVAALDITAGELLALDSLAEILTYHVVAGETLSSDLSDGQMIATLLGPDVTVSITDEGTYAGIFINDAMVTVADIFADNGVLHVIDAVLSRACPGDEDEDGICDDVDECIGVFDACGICNGPGAIYDCGCANVPEGDCDCDGNTLDVLGICGGNCTVDSDNNGVCDDQEIYGCSYPLAENFISSVTRDDGSCIFPCEGVVNTNVFDWDGDYVVTVTDFLMMLSVYGDTDVDLDGVWDSGDDCVDTNACNYANDPSEPCAYIDVLGVCGGGCGWDEDNDGICDDIDTCIGVEDECGVCNGPGPTEVVIDDITILYDSVYLPQLDEWYVYEFGADTTFTYTCAPFFGGCGDPLGYQGYEYATVLIGDQCWFGENLRSANYENGDAIPANLSDSEWQNTTAGAVAVYGEDSGCNNYSPDIDACDPAQSLEEYGRLYNWYAVDDARGLCPSGWHVPTDGEWTVMTDELGGELIAGGEMKTTYGWYQGGNGTNSSGFSGLPGGVRYSNGSFNNAGLYGNWWSASPDGSNAWYRYLLLDDGYVYRSSNARRLGFSVRCVRDAE